MPKLKTRKGVRKRFKVTASGKIIGRRAGKSHLLSDKSRKRKRKLRSTRILGGEAQRNIKKLLAGN